MLLHPRSLVACDFPPHQPAYINLLANRAVNAGSVTLLVPSGTLRKLQSFNAKPFDVFKS